MTDGEWIELINMFSAGDTLDSKNILVLWDRLFSMDLNTDIEEPNMNGFMRTCGWVNRKNRNVESICSNIINMKEKFCQIHKIVEEETRNGANNFANFPISKQY